jgi:penicillin-binding protein 1A
MRAGYSPADLVEDRPVRIGNWAPDNYEGKYRGVIPLRDAFAFSSNVASVRLTRQLGPERVIQTARDFGVTSDLDDNHTIALGTSAISLMEMTSAFAGIANGSYPVRPRGIPQEDDEGTTPLEGHVRSNMLQLLGAVTTYGTGRAAKLPFQTFGKTGTTQGNRDAYFIGFAGDLVTGVWIGRDDNQPVGDVQGGGIPALIWRNFMAQAVNAAPLPAAPIPQQTLAAGDIPRPAPYGSVPADYYVGEYDVTDSGSEPLSVPGEPFPGQLAAGEEEPTPGNDPRPVEIAPPPAPLAGPRPREEPAPERNDDVPTLAAPPAPPAPEDELPADDEGSGQE